VRNPEIRDLLRAECIRRGVAHRVASDVKKAWTLERKHFRLIRRALAYWQAQERDAVDSWQPDGGRYWVDVDKRKVQNTLSNPLPILPCNESKGGAIPIKRVRVLVTANTTYEVRRDGGKQAKFVIPGGNHHVEIYETPGGKWTGRCVSRFEACKRLRRGRPVVCRDSGDGSEFVMSLAINDMVLLTHPETGELNLYRVQKISSGDHMVALRLHTAARIDEKECAGPSDSVNVLRRWNMEKVIVDPIGRLLPCHD